MMDINDLFKKFDDYKRTNGNVIIHPGPQFNILELSEDFVQTLKHELETNICMASSEIDELNAITKFVIMILEESY